LLTRHATTEGSDLVGKHVYPERPSGVEGSLLLPMRRAFCVPEEVAGWGLGIPHGVAGSRRGLVLLIREFTPSPPGRAEGSAVEGRCALERSRTSRRVQAMNRPRGDRAWTCGVAIPVRFSDSGGVYWTPETGVVFPGHVLCVPDGLPGCSSSQRSLRLCGESCSGAQNEKISPKSFTMRTYAKMRLQLLWNAHLQIIGLKVPWNEHLQKIPGGRVSTRVANARLRGDSCRAHVHLVVLSQLTSKTHGCRRRSSGSVSPASPCATLWCGPGRGTSR